MAACPRMASLLVWRLKELQFCRTMRAICTCTCHINMAQNLVLQVWIAQRVTELLGIEDDVLIGYVFEQLDPETHKVGRPAPLLEHLSVHRSHRSPAAARDLAADASVSAAGDLGSYAHAKSPGKCMRCHPCLR